MSQQAFIRLRDNLTSQFQSSGIPAAIEDQGANIIVFLKLSNEDSIFGAYEIEEMKINGLTHSNPPDWAFLSNKPIFGVCDANQLTSAQLEESQNKAFIQYLLQQGVKQVRERLYHLQQKLRELDGN